MDYFHASTDTSKFEEFIKANSGIEFVRHVWVDYSGIYRQRILTTYHCRKLYSNNRRYGIGPQTFFKNISDTDERYPHPKQQLFDLVPDWTSLRVCHFSPGHAWVVCFAHCAEEEEPLYQCPRYSLVKVLERAGRETDAEFLFGGEIEFMLMDEKLQPIDTMDHITSYASGAGLRDQKLQLLEEVVRTLQMSDIQVSHFHTEDHQMLEFATYPAAPLQFADNLLYTHELLRCVAIRYGYRATVSVMPLGTPPTITCGLHFSINKTSNDETKHHFLAGIMQNLPLITPFAMPTYDSYQRGMWDRKGAWISWGTQNREAPIRRIEDAHWELRISDATANFYLLLAVMLSAGLDGMKEKRPLTWQDVRYYPSEMKEEDLAALGVTQRLAVSYRDSLEVVRNSSELDEIFGSEMKRLYVKVKEMDENHLCRMSDEERRKQYIKFF